MKHFYSSIDGWFNYASIYLEAVRQAPKAASFVEIGSWKGRSAAFMGVEIVNSGKQIALHCVDTWSPPDEPWYRNDPDVVAGSLYETFLRNVAPVRHVLTPHRMASVEAAREFEDGSLFFVMVDGTHSYEAVRDDIAAWRPKLAPGGIMAGDDTQWAGVLDAAKDAFGSAVMVRGQQWIVRT